MGQEMDLFPEFEIADFLPYCCLINISKSAKRTADILDLMNFW
jgi:hypothetical protein